MTGCIYVILIYFPRGNIYGNITISISCQSAVGWMNTHVNVTDERPSLLWISHGGWKIFKRTKKMTDSVKLKGPQTLTFLILEDDSFKNKVASLQKDTSQSLLKAKLWLSCHQYYKWQLDAMFCTKSFIMHKYVTNITVSKSYTNFYTFHYNCLWFVHNHNITTLLGAHWLHR